METEKEPRSGNKLLKGARMSKHFPRAFNGQTLVSQRLLLMRGSVRQTGYIISSHTSRKTESRFGLV